MTTAELHEILDDENRKLTADELKELLRFAKSIDSERVELQKDEYLYLLEFIEKLENENLILKQKRLTLWDRLEFVRMAREKAINEFFEKAKEKLHTCLYADGIVSYAFDITDLYEVFKELTGASWDVKDQIAK